MPNISSSSRNFAARLALLVLIIFLAPSCAFTLPSQSNPPAPPLTRLNDWLYRGPQPSEGLLQKLKEKGFRTIVNFRNEPNWIGWERYETDSLKLNYVSLPWKITGDVDPKLLDQFFAVLDDPRNRPIFFHCKRGRDRTGVMSTLALMRYEKFSEEKAREIALETILPSLRYRSAVNHKIDFFIRTHPSLFSESSAQGHQNPEPIRKVGAAHPTV